VEGNDHVTAAEAQRRVEPPAAVRKSCSNETACSPLRVVAKNA
jgi:hypothetical protein